LTTEARKPFREISDDNMIKLYLHCRLCFEEMPPDQSPKEWARVQAGWTEQGIQVWCNRHDANIIHIDFEGQKHHANQSRKPRPGEIGKAGVISWPSDLVKEDEGKK
jgi:hypothetical protein